MEALLWETIDEIVQCNLCHHRCRIKPGRRGICNVRENRSGVLKTLVSDKIVARHIDPIEKKPLYHVFPGSLSYSVATIGCNLHCRFCQNADIAQELPKHTQTDKNGFRIGTSTTPIDIVEDAHNNQCKSIAYTYTEPTVYFEWALETAKLAHERSILNVFVTNGFMTPEAITMISPWLAAANVDLKAFTDHFYRKWCGAALEPVKKSLKELKANGVFIEVTTLLIPGLNDAPEELAQLSTFIANELGTETPWHISRFHPTYKLTDRPPTPLETLSTAREIGIQSGLKYVYTGNVPGDKGGNTYCHTCGKTIVERWGFKIINYKIDNHACRYCGAHIHGIGL